MSYGASKYKKTQVMTANRTDILVMLYEAAIRHAKRAKKAIEEDDAKTKGEAIGKCHDIVNELSNSLNFEVAGSIAQDLERLYNYIVEELLKANMENDPKPIDGALTVLENLLEGWKGAIEKINRGEVG